MPKMMMTVGLLLLSTLGACEKTREYRTAGGVEVQILDAGTGPALEPGRHVAVHYQGWTADDKVFDSSYSRGRPYTFAIGDESLIVGWREGLQDLHDGERRRFTVPPELAYGDTGKGDRIPPLSTLTYEVEVIAPFGVTDSGVQYFERVPGDRDPPEYPQVGQTCVIHYFALLPQSGREFDSSKQNRRPFEFSLGSGHVIPGLEEGISRMPLGSHYELVIPPELAFGAEGKLGVVPPDTDVVYEVHLVGVRR